MAINNATWFNHWKQIADEFTQDDKVDSWFLMGSPFPIIALFLLYVHFAFISGPRMMKWLPKINIKGFIAIYNVFQIYMNGALIFLVFWKSGLASFTRNASCENPQILPRSAEEAVHLHEIYRGYWYYFMMKIADLMDTVFFVINKKPDHITFLHVYHHSSMLLTVWTGFKYIRPIHTVFPGLLNSLAHVIMYSYYLVSIFVPGFGKRHKEVKMAITISQMVQFAIIVSYCLYCNINCPVPKAPLYWLSYQNSLFLILFTNFYIHQYLKGNKAIRSQAAALKKKFT